MIADFRIAHFLSRSDLQAIDDSLNTGRFRRCQEGQLFRSDAFHLTRQDQIIVLHSDTDWIAMEVDSRIPFEAGTDLFCDCFFHHHLFLSGWLFGELSRPNRKFPFEASAKHVPEASLATHAVLCEYFEGLQSSEMVSTLAFFNIDIFGS
jgi:hypothetical protein